VWPLLCVIFVIHYKYLTYVIFEIRHTLHVKDSSHIISIWHWHLPCLRFVSIISIWPLLCLRFVTHCKYLAFVMYEIRHTLLDLVMCEIQIQVSDLCHVKDSSHIISIWPLLCLRFVTHCKISGLCHVWDSSHIISILPLSCLRFVAHYLALPCAIYSTLITNILPLSCARFVTHYKHHPTFDF